MHRLCIELGDAFDGNAIPLFASKRVAGLLQPVVDFGSDLNILSPTLTENSEMQVDLEQRALAD